MVEGSIARLPSGTGDARIPKSSNQLVNGWSRVARRDLDADAVEPSRNVHVLTLRIGKNPRAILGKIASRGQSRGPGCNGGRIRLLVSRCLLLFVLALLPACVPCPDDEVLHGDGTCAPAEPDWSRTATLPGEGHRTNIYRLAPEDLRAATQRGLLAATTWPVDISGVYVPLNPLQVILEEDSDDSTVQTGRDLARVFIGFESMEALYSWVGAPPFNDDASLPGGQAGSTEPRSPYEAPFPPGFGPGDRMGVSHVDTEWGTGLTFSCMTCHAGRMLGRTVVGLPNRRSRANAFFDFGKDVVAVADPEFLRTLGEATDGEVAMLERAALRLPAVGNKSPETLGLDTSLAQVALSLSRRAEDAWASRDWRSEGNPRPNALEDFVADSKPMPFWTLKYKTRWLSDGSVVSGNPVHTNFLWNELGRGTDLPDLDSWLGDNGDVVRDVTAAVFASPAPRWTDFFPADSIDLASAQRGQVLFDVTCSECHGSYVKGWEDPEATDPLANVALDYPSPTPVRDVGTDPQRAQGMQYFADALNDLTISANIATVIEPQTGYVAPPLDGIFARYPYLHNNSVPSLCALLTPGSERPTTFVQGPSEGAEDFDADCVGYPIGDALPEAWLVNDEATYIVGGPGMSNGGHDAWLLDAQGQARFDAQQRWDLIEFLKTL